MRHGSQSSLRDPGAQCQRWKQALRGFIYHWNVGPWRVWVSLGWIYPGNYVIPPTMNLGGLHSLHGNRIPKHRIIESYSPRTCYEYHHNAWKGCLGVVYCGDDEACHVINKGLISPQIPWFPCNQLLTRFIWIRSRVNIYISGRIQSIKLFIGYFLGCQWIWLEYILLFLIKIHLRTLRMTG